MSKRGQILSIMRLLFCLLTISAGFAQEIVLPAPDPVIQPEPRFLSSEYLKRRFTFMPSTKVDVAAPKGIRDFVREEKLQLSLQNFLSLVLANNYDISVQRVLVQINENAVTRAFSIYDPTITAQYSLTRAETPSATSLAGASTLNQLTQPFSATYGQLTPFGGFVTAGFSENRTSNNSTFSLLNPSYSTSLNLSATQPLLRGRGAYITRIPITLARSRLRTAQVALEDRVLQLLVNAELAYWNVIEARDNLRVQEETLKLADTSLKRSQRELELGAISALEIYQPQATYANAEIFVVQAKYRLSQVEDALRQQIGADIDLDIAKFPLALTESVDVPDSPPIDKPSTVALAMKTRQDLKSQVLSLDTDDLTIRQVTENLRPSLSLGINYSTQGLGGTFFGSNGVVPGGVGDSLSQLFGFGYPIFAASVTLQLPVKDRRTTADLADALVNKKLDVIRIRSQEQQVRLQVLNAIDQVENSKASVQLAKIALDLAQKRVDADQKRYELGTTTIFFVLASQSDLAQAAGTLVRESVHYRRNVLQLYQRTGQLLEKRNVVIR
jgi:outer membrane protein